MKEPELEGKKKCSTCNELLPLSRFSKDKNKKDGLCYECRICRKKRVGTYKAEHTKVKCCPGCRKVLKLSADNFHRKLKGFANKCKVCIKPDIRKNYRKNKEKYLEQKKKYWLENKDKIKEYREQNKEELKVATRKRRNWKAKNDPLFKIRKNVPQGIRQAYEKRGLKKKSKTKDIVGCNWATLHKHLVETFEENYGIGREYIPWGDIHIDHIIPLATAETEEDIIKLNHYKNLQLLLAYDNIKKSDSLNWEIE